MQINFMSQTWQIRDSEPRELQECVGLCDPKNNEIILDLELEGDPRCQTLLHEITHVIEMTMNLNLTEHQTDCLAAGWLHLLRANPKLVAMILNMDDYEL